MHILKVHANISADTDADADGICINVYAFQFNHFVGVNLFFIYLYNILRG